MFDHIGDGGWGVDNHQLEPEIVGALQIM
jgi:hypothetical protein